MTAAFIGVTGHRPHKLNLARLSAITADVAAVFAALDAAMAPRPMVCVCSLAEGADTIAAQAALARNWRLVAPLPFPRDDFADDFAQGRPREVFLALLDQAEIDVCTPGRQVIGDPVVGYTAASAAVLKRSDLLVAVWDGQATELPAGAYDTIRLALARSLPVIWIDAAGLASPCALTPQSEAVLSSGTPATGSLQALLASLS